MVGPSHVPRAIKPLTDLSVSVISKPTQARQNMVGLNDMDQRDIALLTDPGA